MRFKVDGGIDCLMVMTLVTGLMGVKGRLIGLSAVEISVCFRLRGVNGLLDLTD